MHEAQVTYTSHDDIYHISFTYADKLIIQFKTRKSNILLKNLNLCGIYLINGIRLHWTDRFILQFLNIWLDNF